MAEKGKNGYWVGFDLGGTKMLATVFDASFKPLVRKRKKTRGFEGEKAGLERIMETIRDALDEAKVDPAKVQGIGIGCPGPLDLDKGIILDAPNLGWENVPIKATLETLCTEAGFAFVAPPQKLCTDNAAMIAWAGIERLRAGIVGEDAAHFVPRSRWPLDSVSAPMVGSGRRGAKA